VNVYLLTVHLWRMYCFTPVDNMLVIPLITFRTHRYKCTPEFDLTGRHNTSFQTFGGICLPRPVFNITKLWRLLPRGALLRFQQLHMLSIATIYHKRSTYFRAKSIISPPVLQQYTTKRTINSPYSSAKSIFSLSTIFNSSATLPTLWTTHLSRQENHNKTTFRK